MAQEKIHSVRLLGLNVGDWSTLFLGVALLATLLILI